MSELTPYRTWRRYARWFQAVVIFTLPFVLIDGESAFRFDIPTLTLLAFGRAYALEEFFFLVVALLFCVAVFFAVTVALGRVWCGWVCPQTVFIDVTRSLDHPGSLSLVGIAVAYSHLVIVAVLTSANLIWYFVSPYDFFGQLWHGELGAVVWGFWITLSSFFLLHFTLVRHSFCTTICPYAKLQGVLFDDTTLVIAFDAEREGDCIKCHRCVKTCPVGIDIRAGVVSACINCAECIDECRDVMRRLEKKTLIDYRFGVARGSQGSFWRPSVLVLSGVSLVLLAILIWMGAARTSFEVIVRPHYLYPPTQIGEDVVNAYFIKVKNKQRDTQEFTLAVHSEYPAELRAPSLLTLGGGAMQEIAVMMALKAPLEERRVLIPIVLSVTNAARKHTASQTLNFRLPERN
ncbi:4Fe-4S dicluster domain-containing protein [Chrysiogenes arsenatis]|uniref:4Fe-4S dicluster domain-containing protein n=1 Tax=Chrysiogenes arsenatis TaxID=309797 RepID=UPI0003F51B4E|nr:4Fe-4S dicluster domain-containing protein [Chrysiogenes arsenatis]